MKTGIELIAEERLRQINEEGYTLKRDMGYDESQLAKAAITYAMPPGCLNRRTVYHRYVMWPWPPQFFKPSNDRVRELTKAGALIAAEIDRLQNVQR